MAVQFVVVALDRYFSPTSRARAELVAGTFTCTHSSRGGDAEHLESPQRVPCTRLKWNSHRSNRLQVCWHQSRKGERVTAASELKFEERRRSPWQMRNKPCQHKKPAGLPRLTLPPENRIRKAKRVLAAQRKAAPAVAPGASQPRPHLPSEVPGLHRQLRHSTTAQSLAPSAKQRQAKTYIRATKLNTMEPSPGLARGSPAAPLRWCRTPPHCKPLTPRTFASRPARRAPPRLRIGRWSAARTSRRRSPSGTRGLPATAAQRAGSAASDGARKRENQSPKTGSRKGRPTVQSNQGAYPAAEYAL